MHIMEQALGSTTQTNLTLVLFLKPRPHAEFVPTSESSIWLPRLKPGTMRPIAHNTLNNWPYGNEKRKEKPLIMTP